MAEYTRKGPKGRTSVSATDAAKNFGELVDRVREGGIAYIVERKGRPIAQIAPVTSRRCTVADLAAWLGEERGAPAEFITAVRTHVRHANRPRVPRARWGS